MNDATQVPPSPRQDTDRAQVSASSLGLTIPAQVAPPPSDSVLLDAQKTEAWLASLPMANVGETARQIFKTLVEFNRMDVPEMQRAKVVEQFRGPLHYIADNLQRHYVDAGFPLSTKGRKIAVLGREIFSELAIAYKIVIEHMLAGQSQQFDRRLLVISLHRALKYLSHVVSQSAVVYEPYPNDVWREIHAVYTYAAHNGVEALPVKDSVGDSELADTSIADLYKHVLAFAATSPYRFRQRHVLAVYEQLVSIAPAAVIRELDGSETPHGRFVVDLWSDKPPVHLSLLEETPTRRCRIVDLRPLIAELRRRMDAGDGPGQLPSVPAATLRQIIASWSTAPKREFVRTQVNLELEVSVGLLPIHAALAAQPTTPPPQQPRNGAASALSTLSGLSELSLTPLDTPAADSVFTDSTAASNLDSDSFMLQTTRPQRAAPRTQGASVKTIDESAGGYCISWLGSNVPRIKVGELVGMRSEGDREQLSLGISRWLRQVPGRGLLVGIQTISPSCKAVRLAASNAAGNKAKNEATAALLLPGSRNAGVPASIVFPALAFKSGDRVWVLDDSSDYAVRLNDQLEASPSFAQFTYGSAEDSVQEPDVDSEELDFDNLWSSL